MASRRPSLIGGAVRGAIAGGLATWLMDRTTTGLLQGQSHEDTQREEAARPNGQSSVANLLDRVEQETGLRLDERSRSIAAQAIHYGLGVVPGAVYGALRRRVPLLGAGGGLLYGLMLFIGNDEVANTELGLAGRYSAYPAATHLRGLVGHAILGIATDTGLDVLGA